VETVISKIKQQAPT